MPNTFYFSDTHTWASTPAAYYLSQGAWRPGLNLTNMSVQLAAAAPAMFQFSVIQHGGSNDGFALATCTVNSGATTGSLTTNVFAPSNTTSFWLQEYLGYAGSGSVTTNMSASITFGDATAPPVCQYGTQPAATAPLAVLVTSALVDAAVTAIGAPWLSVLFDPLIGMTFESAILCGTGPPTVSNVTPADLLDTIASKWTVLQNVMWYSICACVAAPPGLPLVVQPTPPSLTIPPGWPTRPSYTCSNTDVCTTLALILKRLDQLQTNQTINNNQTTILEVGAPGLAYQTGTVHYGLTGAGSLTTAKCVGLRLDIVTVPPGLVLPGTPEYIWDVGWMSVSDGGAMLQEKRITRGSAEWFPPEMVLATSFGYSLNAGVTVNMTELIPKS